MTEFSLCTLHPPTTNSKGSLFVIINLLRAIPRSYRAGHANRVTFQEKPKRRRVRVRVVGTDFAAIAHLLANRHRAAMIDHVIDGRAMTAGELARVAGISPSTASEHLSILTRGGLVTQWQEGRHRYFMIASGEIAGALESLSLICPTVPPRSLRQSREAERMSLFRTCYDHLAGSVAVSMLDAMLEQRWLSSVPEGYQLTRRGDSVLREIGVDIGSAKQRRRSFARPCLDWTERRFHLAGALGKGLADAVLSRRWARRPPQGRGLVLTTGGRTALSDILGLDI